MRVFKFGGASVKDAASVQNIAKIIDLFSDESLIIVVSAMGKTTNAMEKIVESLWNKNSEFEELVEERRQFHLSIISELGLQNSPNLAIEINSIFDGILSRRSEKISDNFAFEYDQIVSLGEVVSTKIIAAFLNEKQLDCEWLDARRIIRTDNNYQEGRVDWDKTGALLKASIIESSKNVFITQGFLGHTAEGFTTTLGREGSDFTAGIIAYSVDADSVTIWKDVPGMLNADPKWFENTVKLDQISFREAIELAYYGASVIHPKTIKPLQNKNIPLFVKSFISPNDNGTIIQSSTDQDANIPSFIFKMNQVLISFSPKDFSFIMEDSLGRLFNYFADKNVKINLMQNSALNFSICVDAEKIHLDQLIKDLSEAFEIKYNDSLELVTIRHYNDKTIERITENKFILLEQKTRQTARIVMRNS